MSVDLPTGAIQAATPRFLDRGGVLSASLGGPDQRIDRLGSKFGCDFQLIPMKAPNARIWISRLIRGIREKARVKFPQPGFVADFSGTPSLNGAHGANLETISLFINSAAFAGKKLLEGQFISIADGASPTAQRYIHQVKADATFVAGNSAVGAVAGAVVSIDIQPPLRKSFPNSSFVGTNPADVIIEGYVKGDPREWSIDNAKIYGIAFTIEEAR